MLEIASLLVEDRVNPIGIDVAEPRFSWRYGPTAQRGVWQTAYQIRVASSEQKLIQNEVDIWDSGKVSSGQNCMITYGGPELWSGESYYWQVYVWDHKSMVTESEIASWEMGLLVENDWQAKWIGLGPKDRLREAWMPAKGYVRAVPLPILRRAFTVDRPVLRARAYICGLGQFELRMNGDKVGDYVLEPGWTNPKKTCQYVVHDITEHLKQGKNAVGVMLGNGFYNVQGELGRYMKDGVQRDFGPKEVEQGDPKLIMQLSIQYEDGETAWIVTDEDWAIAPGPIVYSCLYGGEDYDARGEQSGWDMPAFVMNDSWSKASLVEAPQGKLTAELNPPLKVMEVFTSVQWSQPVHGVFVADLGQNFSGWFAITLSVGQAGSRIRIRPAELVDGYGLVKQELQQIEDESNFYLYTKKGNGAESWHPQFTYTGYRYIQIEGAVPREFVSQEGTNSDGMPILEVLEGHFIYPDIPIVGSFECSNPMWNKIHEIIGWAMLSNMKSVFTDCPHREKLGWLEEVHLMGPSLMYNYELPHLFRKTVRDIADAQLSDGLIPDIAPEYAVFEAGFRDSPEWGSAAILVPWYMYHWYGDKRMLEEQYDMMIRYVHYLESKAEQDVLTHGLGDWADVGPNPPFAQNTPVPITATTFYYYNLYVLSKIAEILGMSVEAADLSERAERVKVAFYDQFYDATSGQYGSGSQTSYAAPLAMGLVDDEKKGIVLDHICRDIIARGYHTTSGDVGHRFVLMALGDGERSDIIAQMLNQTDDPSYGYQILHGATALTEHWDGPTSGKSQNHFMLGHIEEWFYRHLAGISRDYDGRTGHQGKLVIKPYLAEGITWVKANHQMPQGNVQVNWHHIEGKWKLDIELPANMTALVYLPNSQGVKVRETGVSLRDVADVVIIGDERDCTVVQVHSGKYLFEV
jgi:alpha-L-rhamnosidase